MEKKGYLQFFSANRPFRSAKRDTFPTRKAEDYLADQTLISNFAGENLIIDQI